MEIIFEVTQDNETLFVARLDDGRVSFGYKYEGPVMKVPEDSDRAATALAIDTTLSYDEIEDIICSLFKTGIEDAKAALREAR